MEASKEEIRSFKLIGGSSRYFANKKTDTNNVNTIRAIPKDILDERAMNIDNEKSNKSNLFFLYDLSGLIIEQKDPIHKNIASVIVLLYEIVGI
jgi:hypothetical protein